MGAITLSDGRSLGYREHGARDGMPVLWFPGTPGSRLFVPPDTRRLLEQGIRLVVVERPGYGRSTLSPGRQLLDWPKDVAELADALKLARFAVVGFSGGAPYAAAAAFALPARVRRLVIVGGISPLDAPGVRAAIPPLGRLLLSIVAGYPSLARTILRWTRPPAALIQRILLASLAPCDYRILFEHGLLGSQLALTKEALRPGYDGWVQEIRVAARRWDFDLTRINVETDIFWGAHDTTTSLAMAQAYSRIPGARLWVVQDAGHFVHVARWDLVVDKLAR